MDFRGEDRDKHGIFDIVEQKTGSSLSVHKRMQGWKIEFRDNVEPIQRVEQESIKSADF